MLFNDFKIGELYQMDYSSPKRILLLLDKVGERNIMRIGGDKRKLLFFDLRKNQICTIDNAWHTFDLLSPLNENEG